MNFFWNTFRPVRFEKISATSGSRRCPISLATQFSSSAAAEIPKAPAIYISGKPAENTSGFYKSTLVSGSYQYNYDRQAMETLGFTVTDDAAQADLIIGAAALDDQALAAVKAGTPYIGYGSNDVSRKISSAEFKEQLRQLVCRIRERVPQIFFYNVTSIAYKVKRDDVE